MSLYSIHSSLWNVRNRISIQRSRRGYENSSHDESMTSAEVCSSSGTLPEHSACKIGIAKGNNKRNKSGLARQGILGFKKPNHTLHTRNTVCCPKLTSYSRTIPLTSSKPPHGESNPTCDDAFPHGRLLLWHLLGSYFVTSY